MVNIVPKHRFVKQPRETRSDAEGAGRTHFRCDKISIAASRFHAHPLIDREFNGKIPCRGYPTLAERHSMLTFS
jgi:hypothetical protein